MIRSPLFEEIRNYLTQAGSDKQIFLYVPYIKTSALEKLIDGIENKIECKYVLAYTQDDEGQGVEQKLECFIDGMKSPYV